MGATSMLMRNTTAAGPLLLLVLLPRHATAAKYHTVVPPLASASPGPLSPEPWPTTRACGFGSSAGAPAAVTSIKIQLFLHHGDAPATFPFPLICALGYVEKRRGSTNFDLNCRTLSMGVMSRGVISPKITLGC